MRITNRLFGASMAGVVSGIIPFLAFIVLSPATTGESGLYGTPFGAVLYLTLLALFWATTLALTFKRLALSASLRPRGLGFAALHGAVFLVAMCGVATLLFRSTALMLKDFGFDGYGAFLYYGPVRLHVTMDNVESLAGAFDDAVLFSTAAVAAAILVAAALAVAVVRATPRNMSAP